MKLALCKLVAFEGLDATGKSTQIEKLSKFIKDGVKKSADQTLFTHQPSGGSKLGEKIYALTESGTRMEPLTRQLLHLAAHSEHYAREIIPALSSGKTVFMDRCWWSTVAYGVAGGLDFYLLRDMAVQPARGNLPDVVFVFDKPYKVDKHNTPELGSAYTTLVQAEVSEAHSTVFVVPAGKPGWVFRWIMDRLIETNIILDMDPYNVTDAAAERQEVEQ